MKNGQTQVVLTPCLPCLRISMRIDSSKKKAAAWWRWEGECQTQAQWVRLGTGTVERPWWRRGASGRRSCGASTPWTRSSRRDRACRTSQPRRRW
eukprot:scaffold95324_cov28-Tisochrysis_lutea.AAC.3